MTYLDNYDKKVRNECCILSAPGRIRTGFRNKNDIKKAVAIIKDPRNRTAFGRAPIVNVNMDVIEENLIKLGSQKPSGIRAQRLDRGADQVIRPAINQGNDSNDDSSSYSEAGTGSFIDEYSGGRSSISGSSIADWFGGQLNPQLASSGGTEEEFNDQFDNITDLFVSGMITQQEYDQLTEELVEARELHADGASDALQEINIEEADQISMISGHGGRREGAGRPTRAERQITTLTGQTAGEQRQEAGEVVDDILESAIGELEEEERQAEYVPPPRRRFTPVEENDNRGSGSGQSNPNAPSYAPSQYDRGDSRGPGRNDFDREFDTPP